MDLIFLFAKQEKGENKQKVQILNIKFTTNIVYQ